MRERRQDKGQSESLFTFVEEVLGKRAVPVHFDELVYPALTAVWILDSVHTGEAMPVEWLLEYDAEKG